MARRRTRFFRDQKPRFLLAFAFLVWSLLPRYQLVVHSHAGDGDGHRHEVLSGSQVELADRMAVALGASGQFPEPVEFSGQPDRSPSKAYAYGEPSLAPERDADAHAHFQQDLNVSALGATPPQIRTAPATGSPPAAFYLAPDLEAPRAFSARGPPPPSFA